MTNNTQSKNIRKGTIVKTARAVGKSPYHQANFHPDIEVDVLSKKVKPPKSFSGEGFMYNYGEAVDPVKLFISKGQVYAFQVNTQEVFSFSTLKRSGWTMRFFKVTKTLENHLKETFHNSEHFMIKVSVDAEGALLEQKKKVVRKAKAVTTSKKPIRKPRKAVSKKVA